MGIHVFFCDLCGVRVTDVDLRSGQGMRKRHDVICVGCVGLGRAQDWLARHEAPAAAPSPVDVARDRARTIDQLQAPAPVAPQPVVADANEPDTDRVSAGDAGDAASTDANMPATIASTETADLEVTAKVPSREPMSLAQAASGMMAMNAVEEPPQRGDTDSADLEEAAAAAVAAADAGGDTDALGAHASAAGHDSPFAGTGEKDDTRASPVLAPRAEAPVDAGRRGGSSGSGSGRVSRTAGKPPSASRASKPGVRPKSGRRHGPDNKKMMIIFSIVSFVCLALMGGVYLWKLSKKPPTIVQKEVNVDPRSDMNDLVQELFAEARQLTHTDDLPRLEALLGRFKSELLLKEQSLQQEYLRQNPGDDAGAGRLFEAVPNYRDLKSLMRDLGYRKAILIQQRNNGSAPPKPPSEL